MKKVTFLILAFLVALSVTEPLFAQLPLVQEQELRVWEAIVQSYRQRHGDPSPVSAEDPYALYLQRDMKEAGVMNDKILRYNEIYRYPEPTVYQMAEGNTIRNSSYINFSALNGILGGLITPDPYQNSAVKRHCAALLSTVTAELIKAYAERLQDEAYVSSKTMPLDPGVEFTKLVNLVHKDPSRYLRPEFLPMYESAGRLDIPLYSNGIISFSPVDGRAVFISAGAGDTISLAAGVIAERSGVPPQGETFAGNYPVASKNWLVVLTDSGRDNLRRGLEFFFPNQGRSPEEEDFAKMTLVIASGFPDSNFKYGFRKIMDTIVAKLPGSSYITPATYTDHLKIAIDTVNKFGGLPLREGEGLNRGIESSGNTVINEPTSVMGG